MSENIRLVVRANSLIRQAEEIRRILKDSGETSGKVNKWLEDSELFLSEYEHEPVWEKLRSKFHTPKEELTPSLELIDEIVLHLKNARNTCSVSNTTEDYIKYLIQTQFMKSWVVRGFALFAVIVLGFAISGTYAIWGIEADIKKSKADADQILLSIEKAGLAAEIIAMEAKKSAVTSVDNLKSIVTEQTDKMIQKVAGNIASEKKQEIVTATVDDIVKNEDLRLEIGNRVLTHNKEELLSIITENVQEIVIQDHAELIVADVKKNVSEAYEIGEEHEDELINLISDKVLQQTKESLTEKIVTQVSTNILPEFEKSSRYSLHGSGEEEGVGEIIKTLTINLADEKKLEMKIKKASKDAIRLEKIRIFSDAHLVGVVSELKRNSTDGFCYFGEYYQIGNLTPRKEDNSEAPNEFAVITLAKLHDPLRLSCAEESKMCCK